MPRGYVCGCGRISNGPVCPECGLARAQRNAASYYRTPAWRRLAHQCKERDGFCCVACGSRNRLFAHHIEARPVGAPYSELDRPGNLCTLCHSCHSAVEASRRAGNDNTALIRLTRSLAY